MPWRPARRCTECGTFHGALKRGRCRRCRGDDEQARYGREPWRRWYHLQRWRFMRNAQLLAHPFCQCPACGEGRRVLTVASVVDHREPHRGDPRLFWDPDNLQSMAKQCHDRKTMEENR